MRSGDYRTSAVLCQFADRSGNTCTLTNDNTACLHLDRTKLRLITVSENYKVILLNICLHQVRIRCCDQNFTFVKIILRIADNDRTFQTLQNVRIFCLCFGHDTAVMKIHICHGNITDRDNTFQHAILCHTRKCNDLLFTHSLPCGLQRNSVICTLCLADLDILYLCFNIFDQTRSLCLKII